MKSICFEEDFNDSNLASDKRSFFQYLYQIFYIMVNILQKCLLLALLGQVTVNADIMNKFR